MATSARPVALITGASAGIGVALAREAANDGHDLVLVARRREPMEALAAELKSMGAEITVIPADLSRPGAAAALMETVGQRGLAIDTLINNAGLGDTGRFDQENPEKILSMLQVNIIALTELTRLVLPQMVARKHGKVMLLASLAAFQPGPGMAVYYATKAYVLSFGRAIGHELRGTGVTITTLCPGPTTSEFAEVANMQGVALFEGPVPVMTAAEVARQGYAALKAGRSQITTGVINRITAISTFHANADLVDDCRSPQSTPWTRADMSSWCGSPCPLMGWSGRAPALPAREAGKGHQRRGAHHVIQGQVSSRGNRHRYRQELISLHWITS